MGMEVRFGKKIRSPNEGGLGQGYKAWRRAVGNYDDGAW